MSDQEDKAAAAVHWVIAAPMGLNRGPGPMPIHRETLGELLREAAVDVATSVPDRIGAGDSRSIALELTSWQSFSLRAVIDADETLTGLLRIADDVGKGTTAPDEALTKVVALCGEGRLVSELAALAVPAGETGSAAPSDAEALLEEASVSADAPKAAVDRFIHAVRQDGGGSRTVKKLGRKLRDTIEAAVYGTARDALDAPEVRDAEGVWRGLKLLMSAIGPDSGMFVELLDVDETGLVDALRELEASEEGFEDPDAILIPMAIESVDVLAALADFGEDRLAPVVAGVAPSVLGHSDLATLIDQAAAAAPPEPWETLRGDEKSRWLSLTVGRVVVHAEGSAAFRRTTLASGVWAVGTMLARSYASYRSFGQVIGKERGLPGLSTQVFTGGTHDGVSAPTESFCSIRAQGELGAAGVIGLGSGRNDERLVLTAVPTVRDSPDAAPLPAQILTGRIVRFAQWVKGQIPEESSTADAAEVFRQAAPVFLFPGLEKHARLDAAVEENDERKMIVVRAIVGREAAVRALDISFAIPL